MERGVENRVDRPLVQSQFGREILSRLAILMADSAESRNFISDGIKRIGLGPYLNRTKIVDMAVCQCQVYRNRFIYTW